MAYKSSPYESNQFLSTTPALGRQKSMQKFINAKFTK